MRGACASVLVRLSPQLLELLEGLLHLLRLLALLRGLVVHGLDVLGLAEDKTRGLAPQDEGVV